MSHQEDGKEIEYQLKIQFLSPSQLPPLQLPILRLTIPLTAGRRGHYDYTQTTGEPLGKIMQV